MSMNYRLVTDQDFQEAMERQVPIRVFQNDHVVDAGGVIISYNDATVAIQTGVGDLTYHPRELCEFFGMKKR